jgi:hypothetical protein
MKNAAIGAGLYLLVGSLLARKIWPISWPVGRNALVTTAIWPALLYGQAVKERTGSYPKWMPLP